MSTTQTKPPTSANGRADEILALSEAMEYEQAIADEAAEIRGEQTELTPELYLNLRSLLSRPIPSAFIQTVPPTKGKPYESTGIRSVQVQIDRMNNVLTEMWWWDTATYDKDGTLCSVTVRIGTPGRGEQPPVILASRTSAGGVSQGSTLGNIYKGSYTNAAKRAFAALGPGHEVYLGAADLDPDVDRQLAEQAEGQTEPATVGKEIAKKLVDRAWPIAAAKQSLQLAASHTAERDIGDCSTKAKAITALSSLTYDQAERVSHWIDKKEQGTDA